MKALEGLWRRLFIVGRPAPGKGVELDFATRRGPPVPGDVVYTSDTLTVKHCEAGFVIASGDAWFEADVAVGAGRGVLGQGFWRLDAYAQREFFLTGLMMMLRRHGRYGLHANALVRDGRGMLLVGSSGSGKTTLALGLMSEGWSLLSDDAVALAATDDGVEAWAFRRGVSCTADTERFFPALAAAPEMYVAADKRVRDVRALYPERAADSCRPDLVVFPQVTDLARSVLEPLPAVETLVRLSQQSAGIMTDSELSQAAARGDQTPGGTGPGGTDSAWDGTPSPNPVRVSEQCWSGCS